MFILTTIDVDSVLELGAQHVIVATGSSWRIDGVGRWLETAFKGYEHDSVVSVDRILRGEIPQGRIIIYDDDHYYLSSAIALKLRSLEIDVTIVTPEARVAGWSYYTAEQKRTLKALHEAGVELVTDKGLVSWDGAKATIRCVFSNVETVIEADCLIPLTARLPNDSLLMELRARRQQFEANGGLSIQAIGDATSPGIIAAAVYSGHKLARELGASAVDVDDDFARRDTIVVNLNPQPGN